MSICATCEGTGRVVGDDGFGFRPPHSDREEAEDCADCGGTGYRYEMPDHSETMSGLNSLTIRKVAELKAAIGELTDSDLLEAMTRLSSDDPNEANDFWARGEHIPGVTK